MRIAIVGRGVIGLSCGLVLARENHEVTLISPPKSSERMIVSEVAAALWFPYFTSVDPKCGFTEEDLTRPTLEHLYQLISKPRAGISLVPGARYFGSPAKAINFEKSWWHERPEVQYRILSPTEIPMISGLGPLVGGHAFVLPILFMPAYLRYLLDELRGTKVNEIHNTLNSLSELTGFDVVVNCSGLGARQITPDEKLTGIRGQVVTVTDIPYPHNTLYLIDSGDGFESEPLYIVPRGRDVVLGGTADPVDPEKPSQALTPSSAVTERIIRRCALLRPEFAETRDYTAKVGLRPYRAPLRIEWDSVSYPCPTVHCYGHGGSGVTMSWGSALIVRNLIARHVGKASERTIKDRK